MAYIGNTPAENYASFLTETFTVSATTNYTLSHAVTNENEIRLVINGVVQQPGSGKAYTASGTTLTLTSATVSGDVMYAVYLGRALQTVNPPNASVGNSQTAPTIITGQTAETSIATDDTILIHDTSASALRKMTRANFVSGIGGDNTPAFEARLSSGDVTLSNDTATKLNINDEIYDSNNCYDNSSNYRFTPTTSGKYYVYGSIYYQGSATDNIKSFQTMLYKNGSPIKVSYLGNPNEPFQSGCIMIACVTDMNGSSNYLELFAHSEFSTGNVYVKSRVDTFFGAYKLIT